MNSLCFMPCDLRPSDKWIFFFFLSPFGKMNRNSITINIGCKNMFAKHYKRNIIFITLAKLPQKSLAIHGLSNCSFAYSRLAIKTKNCYSSYFTAIISGFCAKFNMNWYKTGLPRYWWFWYSRIICRT